MSAEDLLALIAKQKSVATRACILVMNPDDAREVYEYIHLDVEVKVFPFKASDRTYKFLGLNLRTTTAFPRGYISLRKSHASNGGPKYIIETR